MLSTLKCAICDSNFARKVHLDDHITQVHERKKLHKCNICSAGFSIAKELKRHFIVHEGNTPFKCDICQANFRSKVGLGTHIASTHKLERNYKCGFCERSFSEKRLLKQHMTKKHELSSESTFESMEEFIGKVEAYNEELNKKPFKCAMCDYEVSLKGNLTKHIDAVHDGKKPLTSDTLYDQIDMNKRSEPRPKTTTACSMKRQTVRF